MDYTQLKVGDIRAKLVEGGMSAEEAANIKGKANLVTALETYSVPSIVSSDGFQDEFGISIEEGQKALNEMGSEADLGSDDDMDDMLSGLGGDDFDELSILLGEAPEPLVETPTNKVSDGKQEKRVELSPDLEQFIAEGGHQEDKYEKAVMPEITIISHDHDDIMNMFDDNELADGKYPRAVGLRRVAEQVLGKIVDSKPTQVIISQDHNGLPMSTIVYQIIFQDGTVVADVADCWVGNTDDTFAVHPSATASTRAEGRALRKALNLNVLTAEEMNNPKNATEMLKTSLTTEATRNLMDDLDKETITPTQAAAITAKCTAFKIDAEKFINKKFYMGNADEKAYDSIDDVPYGIAQAMLKELNSYQGTEQNELSKEIPEEIKL